MDYLSGTPLLIVFCLLATVLGAWLFGWLRGPLIVLSGGVALVATAATLFLAYGGFAWSGRGGGTLLLFVIPAGLVAALAWGAFLALWRSLPKRGVSKAQAAEASRLGYDQWQQDMDCDVAALEAKLAKWHLPGERRRLEARLREHRALLSAMVEARQRADRATAGKSA